MALLELGGGYVSALARRAKLPRVNCYHTLENLAKKGLVSFITKDNIRYYSAEPPQKITNMMEEKARYAKKILPELLSITPTKQFPNSCQSLCELKFPDPQTLFCVHISCVNIA